MYISEWVSVWASYRCICIYHCGYLIWASDRYIYVYISMGTLYGRLTGNILYISVWVPVYWRLIGVYLYINVSTYIWASHRCVTVGGTCSVPLYIHSGTTPAFTL